MKPAHALLGVAFLLGPPARAGSLGLGAALVQDLPDAGGASARVGTGVGVQIPIRATLGSHAALRIGGRLDYAPGGVDTGADGCRGLGPIPWQVTETPRGPARVGGTPRCGWLFGGGLTIGPEVYLPVGDAVRPYLAAGAGVAVVGNVFDVERRELIDHGAWAVVHRDPGSPLRPRRGRAFRGGRRRLLRVRVPRSLGAATAARRVGRRPGSAARALRLERAARCCRGHPAVVMTAARGGSNSPLRRTATQVT